MRTEVNSQDLGAKIIPVYFLLAALGGGIALVLLLTVPGDPENAWLLGLSRLRLVMALGITFGTVLFAGLAAYSWVKPAWRERFAHRVRVGLHHDLVFVALVVLSIAGLILGGQLLRLAYSVSDPYVRGYLTRLAPLLFWGAALSLQTFLVLPALRYGNWGRMGTSRRRTLQVSATIFIVFLLIWVVIAWTRIGIQPDLVGWDPPGVPVLAVEVLAAWGFGMLFLWGYLSLKPRIDRLWNPGSSLAKYVNLDVLIGFVLWLAAVWLWGSEPMSPSYFAPEPRPPNYEIYPYSDAALHDIIAQDLLVGEGFSGVARKPLYAMFLAFSHLLAGQGYDRVMMIQVLVLALFPAFIYFLTSALHHRVSGVIAGILVLLRERNAIDLSRVIGTSHAKLMMSDLPAAVGVVLLAWVLVRWLRAPEERRSYPILLGGILGSLMLIRPQIIVLVGAVFLILLVAFWQRLKGGLFAGGLILLGLVLSLGPWMWRGWRLTGGLVLNDPSQMAFLTQQYNLEPGVSRLQRSPGESEGEFARRVNQTLVDFVRQYPGVVAGFMGAHFVHNQVESVLILPTSYGMVNNPDSDLFPYWRDRWPRLWEDCCSPNAYVTRFPFWGQWEGELAGESLLAISLNLILVSIGIAVALKRRGVSGWVPLALSLAYSLSSAVGRYSGWRLILPADWVSLMYYAIGLGQASFWALSIYSGGRLSSAIEMLVDHQQVDLQHVVPASGRFSRFFTPGTAVAFGIFLLGCSVLLVDQWVPARYSESPALGTLNAVKTGAVEGEGLRTFLNQEKAVMITGRALYPRYYKANDGEPGDDWPAYNQLPFARLGFFLAGPTPAHIIMAMDAPPEVFPNASDVLVIGCQGEDLIHALVIEINDGVDGVLTHPAYPTWECPLPKP